MNDAERSRKIDATPQERTARPVRRRRKPGWTIDAHGRGAEERG